MRAHHPLLLLLLALAPDRRAAADGLPIGPAPGNAQSRPAIVSDGRGGALVTFKTVSLEVGAVHVDGDGLPDGGLGFTPAPVPFALETTEPLRMSLATDSQVVVVSDRATGSSPALTSLGSGGISSAGFPVDLSMAHRHPAVVAGLSGRTLILSKNSDATTFWTLRAAIVRADGVVESSVQLPSLLQFFNVDRVDAISDGAGGLIAAFPFYDALASGSKDIAVFRLAADGSRPWGDQAKTMVFASDDQIDPRLAPDGTGGAIMAWTDPRDWARASDIYALHFDANATRVSGWPYYGRAVCDAQGAQCQPRIVHDGQGGAWIVWLDRRGGWDGDLRYSHVRSNGQLAHGFTSSGSTLCSAPLAQGEVDLAGDGAGGFFAVWRDDRNGNADIYAQHVLPDGGVSPGWEPGGRPLTTAPGAQDQPAITGVSFGRAVVAWRDARAGATRIYGVGIHDPATADAPEVGPVAIRIAAIDPARGGVRVRLTLPTAAPAVLELLDIAGRVRARAEPGGPCSDRTVALPSDRALEPGLYFARVRQGTACARTRVTVLR